ncbi:Putative outer membrane protein OmpA [Herminiimonas arsenicoxydans]|uniref:Outer membrane protein OmpA n=1 Tax=Herminiimonas arsenicoxydans TaxID=204773 RepID=A4G867_HERAR|nr:Putative outer membrane protein OmpA [Herminiimonas arsenicoxydans]
MINKLALVLLVGVAPSYAAAQSSTDIQAPSNHSYNQDGRGTITRSDYGLCWRSGFWTPDDAVAGCDGALASPIPNPTAPEMANSLEKERQSMPLAAKPLCNVTLALASDQTFAFNKAVLNKAAKQQIDQKVLPILAECKGIDGITITGHTDHLGASRSNQILSEKRAASVAGYLKTKGVSTKMNVLGAGETQGVKLCDEKLPHGKLIACLAPNRRVLIEVHGHPR